MKIIVAHYCNINLPACFSLPRVEYGALVCSDPQAHFVLDDDGKPVRVLEEEDKVDNQNEVLEMVAATRETETVNRQEEEMAEVVPDQAAEERHKLIVQEA